MAGRSEAFKAKELDIVTWNDVVIWTRQDAATFGVDPEFMLRIAWCESFGNPYAVGWYAGEVGPYQFNPQYPSVWYELPESRQVPLNYSKVSIRMQVQAAARAFSLGLQGHWSCYWSTR